MNELRCPFCKAALSKEGGSYYCSGTRRHCFDIAKSGYVTLTRSSGASGDDINMVRSRTAFLDKGYYLPFGEAVADSVEGCSFVVDAGCGDGYYSNLIASRGATVYGFDLSKYACDRASKRSRTEGNNAFFGVCGVFDMPLSDGCADAVVNLFAPIAEREYFRVLKPGGILVVGAAGRRHLFELKAAVYDTPYENEGRRDLPSGFAELAGKKVKYTFKCAGEDLKTLFMMTPYAFKTSVSDMAKLDKLSELEVTADFDIFIYKKDSGK